MKRTAALGLTALVGIWAGMAGCSQQAKETQKGNMAETTSQQLKATIIRAVVDLRPTQGNNVRGTVTFTQQGEGVLVQADVTGLTPGKHGFHIHENGDCSAPDASSAGGHFNPTNHPHAGPTDMNRHVGDMGNLEADTTGMAHLQYVDRLLSLQGPNSIIGKAVVVHAGEDDLVSQPAGNSGPRVACGVITEDESNKTGE